MDEVLEKALKVAWNELKYKCVVVREYGKTPQISLKENQILQVFLNLLMNAGHAIEGKGQITVFTKLVGGMVLAGIRDDGTGIAPGVLPKIFDPFFTTKVVGKGTGLGLLISLGIINAHGGTIEVESELGVGSTFTVRLPVDGAS